MKLEYQLMDTFGKLIALNARKNNRCIQQDNPTGLTDIQAITLQYIMVESKQRDVFAKDLEVFFDVKPSSVSSLISYLEKAGFIVREPLQNDRRHLKLIVTEKGWEIEDWIMQAIDRSVMNGLSDFTEFEMQTLLELLGKLENNFRKAANGGE